jgi:hypothetical protein
LQWWFQYGKTVFIRLCYVNQERLVYPAMKGCRWQGETPREDRNQKRAKVQVLGNKPLPEGKKRLL